MSETSKDLSVSIVIPNYNGKALLKRHLPQVVKAAEGAEIIVVDDASTDGSVAFLKKHYPKVIVVEHTNNRRFAAACNSGVERASGDIVVLLNNDVSPTKGFLSALLAPFEDDWVFAVGCSEKQNKDSKRVSGKGCGEFRRGFVVHWRCREQTAGPSLWASGGSGAFRKRYWELLGGMDTAFKPAYEEDRDICYRALKRGWQVLFAPKALVYHDHETTNIKALGKGKMQAASYKNQFLLVWKNITYARYLLAHFAWLPYHLTVGTVRSGGMMLAGFLWALYYLPSTMKKRQVAQLAATRRDEKILTLGS